jgi:hypothetical protein
MHIHIFFTRYILELPECSERKPENFRNWIFERCILATIFIKAIIAPFKRF